MFYLFIMFLFSGEGLAEVWGWFGGGFWKVLGQLSGGFGKFSGGFWEKKFKSKALERTCFEKPYLFLSFFLVLSFF